MRMSEEGLKLLEGYEGIRLAAYLDTAGVWTIGVGHTGPEVHEGMIATVEQVRRWLDEDVKEAENAVNRLVKVALTQEQFDSLASFVFNLGETQFNKSTLLKRLNAGDYVAAGKEFKRWVYSGGKITPGLVKRRNSEARPFLDA
jgi:lysozyme